MVAALPSPTINAFSLGPLTIRFYALCIIAGVIVAVVAGERRYTARGGAPGVVTDIAVWAVPFGLVGARLYHVFTDPELYFEHGRHPIDVIKIWDGGLGIWGAVALGAVGGWIGLRRRGLRMAPFADAVAPGIAAAQAIGRLGNWFNNELYGKATDLPWGLTVHYIDESTHRSTGQLPGHYHPTFLYELIWDLGVAAFVIYMDRRYRLGRGRAFALYVMSYTAGRAWIEYMRIDEANHFLGIRLNVFTAIIVFLGATAYFVLRRGPREDVRIDPPAPESDVDSDEAGEAGEDAAAESDAETESGQARAESEST
ncbi:MAG TPA: prolipoprotein diacylglyceryl transferase [Mycobacteriales bacterium]|nr:prolipoprotein diacylglyceryl transferase [Mycobacteriales bacterium]